ncbi:dna damage repair mus42 [Pyrenophora seminiperda CCB06]|uniref:DNA repair protein REV1 n=1 Tax=Pyrenophora seminiperda CCB06 TaxID=1302712 RepID=A0A3M7LW25_9PLEO|nr:dna damage repair mus42 [Pyrenophora seminiperda CCB06]
MGSRLEKNSESVRKRIASHQFDGEDGEEYRGSAFGGFPDYFRRKKIKLQNLDADIRSQAGDKPQIFKGIVVHVNGYTQPSLNDLHTLIVQHGGGFLQYLDGKTTATHIIASNLTPKKAVEFRRYRIVKPAWVVDSIRMGKLLPWNEYRVVDEGEKQNVLAFDNGNITAKANIKARGYREQTEASWYTSQLRGSQAASASTPIPASSMHARFSRQEQRLPTPDDDIEDLLPPHQPTNVPYPPISRESSKATKLVTTPPKTSPSLAPTEIDNVPEHAHDSLYTDPSSAPAQQAEPASQVENIRGKTLAELDIPASKNRALTAEEHNAILLRDPKIRKSTVVDPNFLEQYYRESRLHHLSTWKAELKSQMQALASEKSLSQKAKQKRPPGARRYILHVDFDSFFAAVSLKKHPEYKDKPAVVAHGQGSGSEIASCNYPARTYGVKNGMWMKRAQELCPDLKILPYDFPAYEETSRAFYDVILAVGGVVQSVSIDEALVDVSGLCAAVGGSDGKAYSEDNICREQAKANEIALNLRDEVRSRTGCNVSVGIGGNILLAKVALRRAKPAGQYQIKPEEVLDFIGQLPVQDLPGVAWSIGGKLEGLNIKYVKDIRELTKERLVQTLGPKTGEKLWDYSRGIDRQEVGEQVVRKSVSAEVNWGVRFENQEQVDEFITSLCGELQKRLLKERVKGRQFTMKVMRRSPDAPLDPPKHLGHGKCDTHNKSILLGVATNSSEIFIKEALAILRGFGFTPGELRGIGIQMTKLEPMKGPTDGSLDGSQRRLQFKTGNTESARAPRVLKYVEEDTIQDDPETPRKSKTAYDDDHVAFGAHVLNASTPSRRPLNVLGTQFILPSQVDPKVLAELPEDIRTKLQRQTRLSSPTPVARRESYDDPSTPTKALPLAMTGFPAQCQLDPETLAALPADVRAEILAQREITSSPSRRPRDVDQTLLPQSPRKNRIIGIPAKKPIVPIKRGRGRPPMSAMLAAAARMTSISKTGKTLTQASFLSPKDPIRESVSRENSAALSDDVFEDPATTRPHSDDDLDHDFLAALPDNVRKDVIAQHKVAKKNALQLAVSRKSNEPEVPEEPTPVPVMRIPRPLIFTFTTQNLSKEADLKRAMKQWVGEFTTQGPHEDDVAALVNYLQKVVLEERDLSKAVGLVKWIGYLVSDEANFDEKIAQKAWQDALVIIKESVMKATKRRGLGMVSLD